MTQIKDTADFALSRETMEKITEITEFLTEAFKKLAEIVQKAMNAIREIMTSLLDRKYDKPAWAKFTTRLPEFRCEVPPLDLRMSLLSRR